MKVVNERYEIIARIKDSPPSYIFKARDIKQNKAVILKELRLSEVKGDEKQRFLREIDVLKELNHPNCVKILDDFELESGVYIVLQHLPFPSLRDYIKKKETIGCYKIQAILRQILQILSYLHGLSIMHRDLKPENILYDEKTNKIYLVDFGFSVSESIPDVTIGKALIGTPIYTPPEILKGMQYREKSDVYEAGVVIYEMTCGRPPFVADNVAALFSKILKGSPDMSVFPCEAIGAVVSKMLELDPEKRPDATQALQMLYNTVSPQKRYLSLRIMLIMLVLVFLFIPLSRFSNLSYRRFYNVVRRHTEPALRHKVKEKKSVLLKSVKHKVPFYNKKTEKVGVLRIVVAPWANVYVDSVSKGKIRTADFTVKNGKHIIRMEMPEMPSIIDTINVARDTEVSYNMYSDLAEAEFISSPWAKVFINGKFQCTTPCGKVFLRSGKIYRFTLYNPVFGKQNYTLNTGKSKKITISFQLGKKIAKIYKGE